MVKFIKRNDLPPYVYQGICSWCNSELEAEAEEVQGKVWDAKECNMFGNIDCPVCDTKLFVYKVERK
jgi:hypothetical protein